MNENQRKARCETIAKRIWTILKAEVGAFYANESDRPEITVLASEDVEGGLIRLRYIADHYVYNFAQSGSDWADHYFGVGEAVFKGAELVSEQFTRTRTIGLSEQDADAYRELEVRALVCAGAAQGIPFDAATVDTAVARMLAPGAERRAAQQRAYEAEQAAKAAADLARALAQPDGRCPKCASTDVNAESVFEFTRMKCRACGHSETLSDDDEHYNWAL